MQLLEVEAEVERSGTDLPKFCVSLGGGGRQVEVDVDIWRYWIPKPLDGRNHEVIGYLVLLLMI